MSILVNSFIKYHSLVCPWTTWGGFEWPSNGPALCHLLLSMSTSFQHISAPQSSYPMNEFTPKIHAQLITLVLIAQRHHQNNVMGINDQHNLTDWKVLMSRWMNCRLIKRPSQSWVPMESNTRSIS